jgi:hypothetical protein
MGSKSPHIWDKSMSDKIIEEIEAEIKKAKGNSDDFEIEITEDPTDEDKAEDRSAAAEEGEDYGPKVQKRIQKLVSQRRDAEIQARQIQEQNLQLQKRLERLEQGSKQHAEKDFNTRYQQTKAALYKAVEEGDTEAQVNFQEQMADMRAAMRVAQSQQQQRAQQQQQRQRQAPQRQAAPAPAKAMDWWQQNNWFNAQGFERETAAARAIDVQLDLEGFDKNSDEYYDVLNNRLQKVFPELTSGASPSRQRTKSRQPVAPTTGGSSGYKGNRVKMTQEQLRMARELGINTEAGLRQYEAEIRRQQGSQ